MALTLENKMSGRFGILMRVTLVGFIYATDAHPCYGFGVCKHCNCSAAHNSIQNKQTWLSRATFNGYSAHKQPDLQTFRSLMIRYMDVKKV